jgi:ArsR family transcriptional regulator
MSNYQIRLTQLADQFKALSNPHRLALFQRLMTCCAPGTKCGVDDTERFCVGDLGEGLDIAPSTLSHHLKELQRCGLIQTERRGKNVQCWIDPAELEHLRVFFQLL